jgi:hypothetical protein
VGPDQAVMLTASLTLYAIVVDDALRAEPEPTRGGVTSIRSGLPKYGNRFFRSRRATGREVRLGSRVKQLTADLQLPPSSLAGALFRTNKPARPKLRI